MWRIYPFLLTGSDGSETLRLSDPSFSVRYGRETIRLLDEITEASDPHLVGRPVPEDFIRCVAHRCASRINP